MVQKNKSVLGKFWHPASIDQQKASKIAQVNQISDFLSRLIANRVSTAQEAGEFLDPKIKDLMPDPFHLRDMQQGVHRAVKAIQNKEKICIFADYDVDGATSSALLKNVLRDIGVKAEIYVPDRIEEGYGPSNMAMAAIKQRGTDLLITVDCGSVAFDALAYASEIGLDVIVIDHHLSVDKMPRAVAVINPNRLDDPSSYTNLAAVGVSFLFAVALCTALKKEGFFTQNNIQPPDLLRQLDIVALGTVCDVMTLTGLNRAFVKQGLKIARARKNIGYAALCDIAQLEEAISCYHLGFVLGPRINAGGRVGDSSLGAALLSTTCSNQALKFSEELNVHNENRKAIEISILNEAYALASLQANDAMIFVYGEGWHPGVIGIVAGRLKESFNKPVAVVAINDGIGKGSCRSVKGCDFGAVLLEAKLNNILVAGGGHAMAAGFTVEEKNLSVLKEFLTSKFAIALAGSDAHLQEFYDLDLSPDSLNNDGIIDEINLLEPFGNGNPMPTFRFTDLFVLKADVVGGKHLKVMFAPSKNSGAAKPINAMAFNAVSTVIADIIMSKKPYNLTVYGNLKENIWQNRRTIQLHIKDLLIQQ